MMKNVLIVEDSFELLRSIKLVFKKQASHLNILSAENGEEAIDILEKMPVSVLVTDLYMPKVDGLELLAYTSRHYPEIPCIIMTGFNTPETMEVLANLGIYRLLEKPFDLDDLIKAITDAGSQSNKGKSREQLSITNFLKLLEEEQRNCALEVINHKGLKGSLYLIDGRLYDAKCDDLQSEDAAIKILGWGKASFKLNDLPPEEIEAQIDISLTALISKAVNLKKKNKKTNKNTQKKEADKINQPEILFQAILSAESGNTKQAQDAISNILKINPKNSKAWLWYSRTADSFKAINASLKNASIIAPNDPEIAEEIRKVNSAVNSGSGESSNIKHCFFCWAPVIREHTTCHYCNAHLDIHESFSHSTFFGSKNRPDLKIILEAFQRFTKATILDPQNPKARFFLAMTHVNLDQWDEALEDLKQTKDIAPECNPYQKQLDILSDSMDNLSSFFTPDTQQEEAATTPDKPRKKDQLIMVVEDSKTTRTVIRKMLNKEGYNVIEANDGIEAIAKFKETIPDLILLDIIMPGLDGYQTLATLKKIHDLSNIPVIMLTAKDTLIDKLKGKMSGSTEYLTKPFNALNLIKKVGAHLN
jgi:twitching motility two-component system response regulator PilG